MISLVSKRRIHVGYVDQHGVFKSFVSGIQEEAGISTEHGVLDILRILSLPIALIFLYHRKAGHHCFLGVRARNWKRKKGIS